MHKITSLFFSLLFLTTAHVLSMEFVNQSNDQELVPLLAALPDDIATNIIAPCKAKDMVRQTCKHFSKLASKRTNKNILTHKKLWLTQTALDLFLLEYGAVGESTVVRNLLDKGADPNACDDNYMTVMHYAAECGDVATINVCLNSPVLIAIDITDGARSPYQLAVNNGHINVIKYLLEKEIIDADGLGEHLITAVAKKANNKKYHVNVNKKDQHGLTPLFWAIEKGDFYRAKVLLQHGADINKKDKNGLTPLHSASRKGYCHIVSFLLHQGVNVNEKNALGETPLHWACHEGYTQLVMLLLHNGAHVNEKVNSGSTSLHLACTKGHCDIVRILLRNGANINERSKYGERYLNPLDVAWCKGQTKVAELLKQHGGKTEYELREDKGCAIQ